MRREEPRVGDAGKDILIARAPLVGQGLVELSKPLAGRHRGRLIKCCLQEALGLVKRKWANRGGIRIGAEQPGLTTLGCGDDDGSAPLAIPGCVKCRQRLTRYRRLGIGL